MRVGIHLPHIGRKAGPEAIRRAAVQAEELGFADAWTSEHIIIPKAAPYPPSAIFYDPVTFPARHIPAIVEEMRMLPQPVKPIPIWIGGSSEAALARAVRLAEGWHGSRLSPEQAAPVVRRLREQRPEPEFTISLRYGWDGKDDREL